MAFRCTRTFDLCVDEGREGDSTPPTSVKSGRKHREVSRDEAEKFAREEGLLFIEASAKTGENVDRVGCAFEEATRDILHKIRQGVFDDNKESSLLAHAMTLIPCNLKTPGAVVLVASSLAQIALSILSADMPHLKELLKINPPSRFASLFVPVGSKLKSLDNTPRTQSLDAPRHWPNFALEPSDKVEQPYLTWKPVCHSTF
ncbi:Ras domain-containing protein [Rhizoctonia solani AG-1 IA]|uniref:Ras domain-containing protein n=1 Tax=Thanatephorus cucumeris (strain AG1-IA) TaxID=983506 RepID=L8WH84_THACA|nr:Ras domain-containing protein [Rhizoctonia solani AG-1 IA]